MHRRFEIDDRHTGVPCKRIKNWVRRSSFQSLQRRKCSNADRHAISIKHPHELGDVFRFVAIHYCAFAMLQSPTCAARLEHYRVATSS